MKPRAPSKRYAERRERQAQQRKRRGECLRKIGYRDKREAYAMKRKLETERLERGLTVYECPHCGLFHVGHRR